MDKAKLISRAKKFIWIPLAGLFIFWSAGNTNYISTTELTKDELTKIYAEYYLASQIDSFNWKGSVKNCDAGTLPAEIYTKAEKRINFFRLGCRLPKIKIVNDLKKEAQAAALMMYANGKVDHNPTEDWKCFSEEGKRGAGLSCLGFSDFKYFPQSAFINDFVTDPGEGNYFCGHRRWILYSKIKKFSFGAARGMEALAYVNEFSDDSTKVEFISYPWNGAFPVNLIYPKWSFHIPEKHAVNFDKVIIKITDEKNVSLPFKRHPEMKEFLDHTLTWNMTSLFTKEEEDYQKNELEKKGFAGKTITVKIENVTVDGKTKNFEYKVKIVKM